MTSKGDAKSSTTRRLVIAARCLDGLFGVRVDRKLVLSGHQTIGEAQDVFDALPVIPDTDGPSTPSRAQERPCVDLSGHFWAIPRPEKGNGGETTGRCKHCQLERPMTNVEGPVNWNGGRL